MKWLSRWWNKSPSTKYRPVRNRPQVEGLEDRAVPTVTYNGGGVLSSVKAQAIYYGGDPTSAQTNFDNYLSYIVKSPYMDALTSAGYHVNEGSAVAGFVDSGAPATQGTVITDQSIEQRLQFDITNAVKTGVVQNPDGNNLYVIVVAPNVAVSLPGGGNSINSFLGYHSAFNGTDANGNAQIIHYAVITTPGGSINFQGRTFGNAALPTSITTKTFDQYTDVTSHELAEAVTDPTVGLNNQVGWYDYQHNGEIGDITENNPNAYIRLGSASYLVQEVAKQDDSLLVINTSSTPTPPTPPPTPTPPPPSPTPPTPTPGTTKTTTTITPTILRPLSKRQPAVVLFTIDVSAASVAPNGVVELIYNGNVVAEGRVRNIGNGVAQITFEALIYQSGNYSLTATYLGNSNFQTSTSQPVTVTV